MAAKTQTLTFKRTVNAPPSEVYRAFTNSTALRAWMCNSAQADTTQGGRLYLWWNDGYYATGEFTKAEPGKRVAFTWHGKDEPGATQVRVSLIAKNGHTTVTVTHAGFGSGKQWAEAVKELETGWKSSLENLQSALETGQDLRFVLRPMLGVNIGEFNPEIAARLGVPIKEGVRLDGVVEGMGAQAAGLQKDDVLVRLGGKKVSNWPTLTSALQDHRAGDKVTVVFYRGGEKRTATMELSRRPLPEIPQTAQALAEAARKMYTELDAELAQCFEGASEEAAGQQPAPGEWSATEIVAHLLAGERDQHHWITDWIGGHEAWYDGWGGNITARNQAIVNTYRTVPELLGALRCAEAETVALLAALPPEFVARKYGYWQVAYNVLQAPDHMREHFREIRAALEAARTG
ncbi:MAG: SRPBCC domain-containing protein [Anaerolineales bacterium]